MHMGAAATAQFDGRDAWAMKQYQNQLLVGGEMGVALLLGHIYHHRHAPTPHHRPITPSSGIEEGILGSQTVCSGRGCAEHQANMAEMKRRKQSKKSGLARTTFPYLKKATASPLLHHSILTGYYEGMVPRSLACCQWEAHRRHILWHHLLGEMGFVL